MLRIREYWWPAARRSLGDRRADLGETLSFADARAARCRRWEPVLVVFGTGWGLAAERLDSADERLERPFPGGRGGGGDL